MRVHPLCPLLLGAIVLISSCSNDFIAEGIYRGELVMSDGSKNVKLELLTDNTIRMKGLFDCIVEGTWEKEVVGGCRKNGVWQFAQYVTLIFLSNPAG